jgi:aldose 1-epimerase
MRLVVLLAFLSLSSAVTAVVSRHHFGEMPDGRPVRSFTLKNSRGMVAKFIEYGATLTELHVPDAKGRKTNVTLGFDNLEQYLGRHPAFGATIGRFANRIAGAKFTLDGEAVEVTRNSGPNHIHGGKLGFAKVLWSGRVVRGESGFAELVLEYTAKDGEEGFPGELKVRLTVTLTKQNELSLKYRATTSKPTVVNLTNHGYFNLSGAGDILAHEVQIFASSYTVPGKGLIPTGEISSVAGTALDFRQAIPVGARIKEFYEATGGYDHNYVVDGVAGKLRPAAKVRDPKSGRVMEVLTTEPAVQLYTLNGARTNIKGIGGVVYKRHAGLALETQHFPDSPNHSNFPSTVLRPGETFESTTLLRFSVGE